MEVGIWVFKRVRVRKRDWLIDYLVCKFYG